MPFFIILHYERPSAYRPMSVRFRFRDSIIRRQANSVHIRPPNLRKQVTLLFVIPTTLYFFV